MIWLTKKVTWIIILMGTSVALAYTIWTDYPKLQEATGLPDIPIFSKAARDPDSLLFKSFKFIGNVAGTGGSSCTTSDCHNVKFYSFNHSSYSQGACTDCHKPHSNKKDYKKAKLIASVPELCTGCHEDQTKQLQDLVVHGPYAAGKCLSCHSHHGSNNIKMLREDPQQLCRSCHNQESQTKRNDVHFPYIKGYCVACHTGHSSNNAARLVSPQKQICKMCHPRIAGLDSMTVKMKPFAMGVCTRCHNPHSADNPAQLQRPMPTLCADCHDQVWGLFFDGKELPKGASRHDVPEGLLTCVNCHRPHGSVFRRLLWRNFDQGKGCGACHLPHGSDGEKLLVKKDVREVCLQCHKREVYRYSRGHPVANRFDPNAKTELSCISTCHSRIYWPPEQFEASFKGIICRICHVGHFSGDAGIAAPTAKGTKLLWVTLDLLKERARWPERYAPFQLPQMGPRVTVKVEEYPSQQFTVAYSQVQPPYRVSVENPQGKTRVEQNLVNDVAKELVGNYHRLPQEDQYKIRSDRGCMLCHDIKKLPEKSSY